MFEVSGPPPLFKILRTLLVVLIYIVEIFRQILHALLLFFSRDDASSGLNVFAFKMLAGQTDTAFNFTLTSILQQLFSMYFFFYFFPVFVAEIKMRSKKGLRTSGAAFCSEVPQTLKKGLQDSQRGLTSEFYW